MAETVKARWRRSRVFMPLVIVAGVLLAAPPFYLLAAVFFGTVPVNAFRSAPESGVTIFVRTNGVHTWIVMPKVSPQIDWRPVAPGAHLGDPRWGAASHVAVGYGNREFYLNTPTWGDLTLPRAAEAFSGGGRSLLHVEHVHDPQPDEWQRPILLTPEEYGRLAAFVRVRFQLNAGGETLPVLGRGYGASDMFYEANGGYSFYLTCNEWTGRALRTAGVTTGLWTPFSESIMWRLD